MFSIAVILITGLLLLIGLAVPVPFAIALISGYVLKFEAQLPFWLFLQRMFKGLESFILIAIPFFILTGNIMNRSGITEKLVDLSHSFVGHLRGGLAHVNIVVSMFFAGISGSSTADTAGIGSILIPSMTKRGYKKDFTVAVTAASSTLGVIIPPSTLMIVYAVTTGTSIAALFLAGIIPGIIIGLGQMGLSYFYAIKYKYPREKKSTLKELLINVKNSILPLGTPIIIIGGVVGGIFTATEASVVAVVYSLILSMFVYKTITIKDLPKLFIDTALLSSLSLFCLATSTIFGWLLSYFRVPQALTPILQGMTSSPVVLLSIITITFLIVGTFMDAIPAIMIFMPVILPIAQAFDIQAVHLGLVVVISLALGLITPPYGLCLLLACSIAKIPVRKALKTTAIFLFFMIILLAILVIFPDIVLFIPKLIVPNFI